MDIPILSPAFGWVIKNINYICGNNYLVTLIIFAVLMKLVLFPFGIKQQKNSIKQARIRPKEMAIRKKYAGRTDRATQQKMNEEIMRLQQEEHISPFSGCLPLLLQMPILFALYGVITKPMTYISNLAPKAVSKVSEVALQIKNFGMEEAKHIKSITEIDAIKTVVNNADKVLDEEKGTAVKALVGDGDFAKVEKLYDGFDFFGLDLSQTATFEFNPYIWIPILTFVFAFFSSKIIRKFSYQPQMGDASQKKSFSMMDWMMPLLSVYISFIIPAVVAVYWMIQNVLSAVQQIILAKMYPIPEVTPEQIREAELAMRGKSSNKPVKATYEIDDYDKTEATDKSGSKTESNRDNALSVSSHKASLTPKLKARIKETGKAPIARRKI